MVNEPIKISRDELEMVAKCECVGSPITDARHRTYTLGEKDSMLRYDPANLEMSRGPWHKIYHIVERMPLGLQDGMGADVTVRRDGCFVVSGWVKEAAI